jgi:hypothetical protein
VRVYIVILNTTFVVESIYTDTPSEVAFHCECMTAWVENLRCVAALIVESSPSPNRTKRIQALYVL